MASKLSIVKLNEVELSLIISSVEMVTVKGRDAVVVASALKKLDRAREKFLEDKPLEEQLIPLSEVMGSNGVPQEAK
jgi:hypothetical protein